MLKQDLILQIMKQIDGCLWEKIKKVAGLMKDESEGQTMKAFVGLRAKTYSYLKDRNDEGKKAKGTKSCVIIRKLKFKDYKSCLKASQVVNTVNYLEKTDINADCFKEDQRKFVEKNKLVLNKDLKVKNRIFLMKKLTRLILVKMIIKKYNQLIQQKHMHME